MKFSFAIVALAGLVAASPAPIVDGKRVCGSAKQGLLGCPFGTTCVLTDASTKAATGFCQSL
ncbi:hypothetical protein H0G86_010228 [Trichoderma simmonsii]|uniref:SSCRP protein n=2 Tax=Trichoderma TaxID=5543 RepID=A0A9P5C6C8_9HYPO|nr:hypothetical protein CFAM422_012493 [Trichoderma lentiforme]QYT03260.1 hypothetical protein H0G86_010228 [Trichoderma simmonsii]